MQSLIACSQFTINLSVHRRLFFGYFSYSAQYRLRSGRKTISFSSGPSFFKFPAVNNTFAWDRDERKAK